MTDGCYIVADSAFSAHRMIIPPFKCAHGGQLPVWQETFNRCLSNLRVCIEHAIGVLKARFQFLKSIRVVVRSRSNMKQIVELVEPCVIIHNLCIDKGEPIEWEYEHPVDTDHGRTTDAGTDTTRGHRREELLSYVFEHGHLK